MDPEKKQKLEEAGWRFGDAADFLGLSQEEAAMIDIKILLGRRLRACRASREWTQTTLAEWIGSSQSRVAKMEVGHPSVSLDLLVRTLLRLGVSSEEVGQLIGDGGAGAAA